MVRSHFGKGSQLKRSSNLRGLISPPWVHFERLLQFFVVFQLGTLHRYIAVGWITGAREHDVAVRRHLLLKANGLSRCELIHAAVAERLAALESLEHVERTYRRHNCEWRVSSVKV